MSINVDWYNVLKPILPYGESPHLAIHLGSHDPEESGVIEQEETLYISEEMAEDLIIRIRRAIDTQSAPL